MRQRKPDGADLVIAGRLGIDDAARGVKVRLGVAVIEQPALGAGDQEGGEAECDQGAERETQNAVQVLNSR
jgi:hypothetical protein